jgi:O-antigen ligase
MSRTILWSALVARAAAPSPRRDHVVAALCSAMPVVGAVKGSPALAGAPVEPTVALVVLALVGAGVHLAPRLGAVRLPAGAVLVVVTLVPGALVAVPRGYQDAKLGGMVLSLAVVAASAVLLSTRRRRRLWLAWTAGWGLAMVAALQVLPRDESQWGRAALEGSNTIAAGRATATAALVLGAALMLPGPRPRARLLAGAVVAAVAAVATGSRGPVLAAAVGLVVVALVVRRGRWSRVVVLTGGLLAAGAAVVVSDSPGADRLGLVLTGDVTGAEARLPLWRAAVRAIWERGPGGTGWGGFVTVLDATEAVPTSGDRQYAHNVVLEAFAEGGWLAGTAVSAVIVASLVRALRRAREAQGAGGIDGVAVVLLGVAVSAVLNASVSGDLAGNRLAWVALALAWWSPPADERGRGRSGTDDAGRARSDLLYAGQP